MRKMERRRKERKWGGNESEWNCRGDQRERRGGRGVGLKSPTKYF